MAGRQRKLEVILAGDDGSLTRTLSSSERAAGSFESRMQGVASTSSATGGRLRSFESRLKSFSSKARSAGRSLTLGLTLPLIGFGALAFQELNAGAEAMAQTRAVIESTGNAAQTSAPKIAALAGELSELSSIDDEDLQGMLNKLLTFTNIAPRNFERASRAVTDLSVSMGTDLDSAAIQVGKALNDPIKGLTALTRVGVTFTQAQKDMIRQLVFFGDTAGAQRIILHELNREFGGSAGAFGRTPAARLRRLKMRFEEMGASILTNLMPALEDLAGVVEDVMDAYEDLDPEQQKFVAWVVVAAILIGPLSTALGLLATAVRGVLLALTLLSAHPLVLVVLAWAAAIYVTVTRWDDVKAAAGAAIGFIRSNIPGASGVISAMGTVLGGVINVVGRLIDAFIRMGQITFQGLTAAFQALTGNLSGALQTAGSLLSTIQQIFQQGLAKVPIQAGGGSSIPNTDAHPDAFRVAPIRRGAGFVPISAGESSRTQTRTSRPVERRPPPRSRRQRPAPVVVIGNMG